MFKEKKSWTLSTIDVGEKNFSSKDAIVSTASLEAPKKGMSYHVAAFFLVAQMAGAGFLALPKAIDNSGWVGLPLLVAFCLLVAFSGTRLGRCWVILEERWPEYRKPARQPYMEIAQKAYGKPGRFITMIAVLVTLIGSSIVYIILISHFISSMVYQIRFCVIVIIVGLSLIPLTWPGTPKDFWQASVLAVVATFIACAVIFVQLLLDRDTFPEPRYESPTFSSFALGFGTILFSFGGASVFPTIQNDMEDRSQFWKSVIVSFAALLVMYLPVAATGYTLLGVDVPSDILLYAGDATTTVVKVAIVLQVINLIVTYLIAFNPICQIIEEGLNMPRKFGWRRIVLRTTICLLELVVALAFPDFGLVLNLVGGSSVTLCSFLLPPIFYMKLVKDSDKNKDWPQRSIALWEKMFLSLIVIIGITGGISATQSAVVGIVDTPFGSSCFSQLTASNLTNATGTEL